MLTLPQNHPWTPIVDVLCPGCQNIGSVDLRTLDLNSAITDPFRPGERVLAQRRLAELDKSAVGSLLFRARAQGLRFNATVHT